MTSETLWTARRVLESWLENAIAGEDIAPEQAALNEILIAIRESK